MHTWIRSAALSWLGLAAACATTNLDAPPAAPSAEARTQFGDVSVVLVPEPVQYEINTPTSGWAKGLAIGTARGVVAMPLLVLGGVLAGEDEVTGMFLGGAVAVGYLPYSVINGALTTVPRHEVEAARPAFRKAFEDPSLPDRLLTEFSRRAETHLAGVLVPADEATTVMEIRLLSIKTGSPMGFTTLDDDFDIVAMASARVVRRADQRIVSESVATDGTDNFDDGGHPFLVWAGQDADLLRHRLDEAMNGLAESLTEVVFVRDDLPAPPVEPPKHPPLSTPDEMDLIWGWPQ